MSAPRLTTEFWVSAYRARLRLADIAHYLTAKGDPDAGTVIVKCATPDGQARAYSRSYDLMTGARNWMELTSGPEREVDEVIARARSRDRDLWVIELEDRAGRTLLEEPGLRD